MNTWHHVVGWSGPEGDRIYIDGEDAALSAEISASIVRHDDGRVSLIVRARD